MKRSSARRTAGRRSQPEACPTAKRVGREPEERQHREDAAEEEQRHEGRPVPVDELRQQAREEDGDLRVAEIAEEALAERPRRRSPPRCGACRRDDPARAEQLDPDPRRGRRRRRSSARRSRPTRPAGAPRSRVRRRRPDRQADRDADRREHARSVGPPTTAFFVTIAVSGPGITIRRIEIARNGSSATCMAASMPDATSDSETESHSLLESRRGSAATTAPPASLPRARSAWQRAGRRRPAAVAPPGRRRRELLGQHRRPARRATGRPCGASSSTPTPIRTATSRRPSDARTMAGSPVAIVNGIGYDNWASQLLAAEPRPAPGRARRRRRARPRSTATTRTSGTRRLPCGA